MKLDATAIPGVTVLFLAAACGGPQRPGGLDGGAGRDGPSSTGNDARSTGDSGSDAGPPDACHVERSPDAASCATNAPGTGDCGGCRESCCTSMEVEGGTYFRTYKNDGAGPTSESDPATISAFRLDRYLVNVARFRPFVSAWKAGWLPPAGSGKHTHLNGGRGLENSAQPGTFEPGWAARDDGNIGLTNAGPTPPSEYLDCGGGHTWTPLPGANEAKPINCVSWYEAYAFCVWDGGFLTSEAEWEYAAAGGKEQREFPWGNAPPGSDNLYAICGSCCVPGACNYPDGKACLGTGTGSPLNIAPVGTAKLGSSVWGQLDMAGEVYEWNLDEYAPYVSPCTSCAYAPPTGPDPSQGPTRVLRGGSFLSNPSYILPTYRDNAHPGTRTWAIGFRCARTP